MTNISGIRESVMMLGRLMEERSGWTIEARTQMGSNFRLSWLRRKCFSSPSAHAQKADAIIRGLRALSDFEFEFNMALMNRHLQPQIETLFVMPNEQFSYTSSSLVKQVAKYGGDVGHFVPPNVAAGLKKAYKH